jgi:hypothetical protein
MRFEALLQVNFTPAYAVCILIGDRFYGTRIFIA